MPQADQSISATELLAFLVVECGVRIDLKDFQEMSPDDPLVAAILEAWKAKQDREASRFAVVASTIANVFGNKTKPTDFFQYQSEHNRMAKAKDDAAKVMAFFMAHNQRIKG